jgi:DNA ligase-1
MLNILNQLSDTNSRNDKAAILKSISDEDKAMFVKIAYLAYSPSIDFYVIEFEESETHSDCVSLGTALDDIEHIIAARVFTGNMAKQWIEDMFEMLSEEDAEVFKRVVKRDLRIGMGPGSINKVFPDTVYVHPYMRCSSFSAKNLENISYPCFSQTKMDGLYVDIMVFSDKVEYRSRNGSYLDLNHEETDNKLIKLFPNSVIMGEAVALGEDLLLMERAESNGYLNSNDIDKERVQFYLWDKVSLNEFNLKKSIVTYYTRFYDLTNHLNKLEHERFILVDSIICENQDDIIEHFKKNRLKEEEGTVVKDFKAEWKNGTSKHLVKIKVVFECELKVVGYKEGTGKNKGMLGAITFQSSDGLIEVSVGTGYTDNQRIEWWGELYGLVCNNAIATIRANDVVSSESKPDMMSLFHPRFVEWRTDKTEADSKDKILEQVKSFTDALSMIK